MKMQEEASRRMEPAAKREPGFIERGYQPTGNPLDLTTVHPPKVPTAVRKPGIPRRNDKIAGDELAVAR